MEIIHCRIVVLIKILNGQMRTYRQHYMKWHIKSESDQKWGYIFITQERIESLIDIVKSNDLVQGSTYVEILERWKQGKYEKVDGDHNKIWKLQSGNLGEGKGVMSEAEQKN